MTTDVGVVRTWDKNPSTRDSIEERCIATSKEPSTMNGAFVPIESWDGSILIDYIAACCQLEGRRAGERGRQRQPQYCVCVPRRELGQKTIQKAVKLFRGMMSVRNIHLHERQSCSSFLTFACTWRIYRQRWTRAWPTNAV